MPTEAPAKPLVFRWGTLKGMAATILFLFITVLIEYSIVVYTINLGTKDETLLQTSFLFPGTDWNITISVSPIFHLVPIAVIITLLFSWTYLTKHIAVRPKRKWKEKVRPTQRKKARLKRRRTFLSRIGFSIRSFFGRIKSGLLKVRGIAYLWQKIHFARATIKSALTVLLIFSTLILVVSLVAYPQLVYRIVSGAYSGSASLRGFVRSTSDSAAGIAEALAPIAWIGSSVTNAMKGGAAGFRNFALSFGNLIRPLAELDNIGKYLVFQNVAAWTSAFIAMLYGLFRGRLRFRKVRRR